MKGLHFTVAIVTIFLCFTSKSYSQCNTIDIVPVAKLNSTEYFQRPCVYFKDINGSYSQFIGTWIYSSGGHYFKITFFKKEHLSMLAEGQSEDALLSNFLYKNNDVVKFDTYPANLSYVKSIYFTNPDELNMVYREPSLIACSKDRNGIVKMIFSQDGNSQPILTWHNDVERAGYPIGCGEGLQTDVSDFLVPIDMILYKQP